MIIQPHLSLKYSFSNIVFDLVTNVLVWPSLAGVQYTVPNLCNQVNRVSYERTLLARTGHPRSKNAFENDCVLPLPPSSCWDNNACESFLHLFRPKMTVPGLVWRTFKCRDPILWAAAADASDPHFMLLCISSMIPRHYLTINILRVLALLPFYCCITTNALLYRLLLRILISPHSVKAKLW